MANKVITKADINNKIDAILKVVAPDLYEKYKDDANYKYALIAGFHVDCLNGEEELSPEFAENLMWHIPGGVKIASLLPEEDDGAPDPEPGPGPKPSVPEKQEDPAGKKEQEVKKETVDEVPVEDTKKKSAEPAKETPAKEVKSKANVVK